LWPNCRRRCRPSRRRLSHLRRRCPSPSPSRLRCSSRLRRRACFIPSSWQRRGVLVFASSAWNANAKGMWFFCGAPRHPVERDSRQHRHKAWTKPDVRKTTHGYDPWIRLASAKRMWPWRDDAALAAGDTSLMAHMNAHLPPSAYGGLRRRTSGSQRHNHPQRPHASLFGSPTSHSCDMEYATRPA
jgi:hypothetical protein